MALLVAAGQNLFWSAHFTLVAQLASTNERDRWYGLAAELIHDPTSNALAAETAPDALRGRYLAIFQLSWSVAAILAPGLFMLLFTVQPVLPWLVVLGLILVASLTIIWIEPHLPRYAVRVRTAILE